MITIESLTKTYGGFTADGGANAMARLLEARPDLDGVFVASEILAKHDEDYMPRELVDSLEQHSYQAPNS